MLAMVNFAEPTTLTADPACPAEQELFEFTHGRSTPAASERIRQHLSTCSKCRAVADTAGKSTPKSTDTTRLAPVDGISGNPTDADEVTSTFDPNEEFDVSQLSVSQEVGSLGRLGEYEILGILGRGGYGIVLRAKDNTLGRSVAIKVLEQGFASSAKSRRRFTREAKAAAQVNHPNVVTIHAIDEHDGMPFLVMELVAGKSLRDWIRDTPKREFMDILRIGAQIAQGLAAAHAQGVIHRDVKPANIMLEAGSRRVKITDFGLARVAVDNVEMTSRQVMVGTPAYMAPEQFRGEEIDARTDLFAFGCVLYSMCAGHSPFHGRTVVEIATLVNTFDPPNLADQDAAVPRFLGDMIVRLLEKDPDKRYQSAAEVADVLNRHLTTFNAAPTDEIPRLLREGMRRETGPRRRWQSIIPAVAVAALAATIWFVASHRDREHSGGGKIAGTTQTGNLPEHGTQKSATGSATSTTSGATTGATPPDTPAPIKKTESVTVASDGSGDFQTISEALAHVLPGGKIVVLDEAEYTEPIVVRDPVAFSGVHLIAQRRAVLKAPSPTTVVRLKGVPGFQISGFRILAAQSQHALELTGDCAGTRVHDIQIDRVGEQGLTHIAAVYLHQGAAGSAELPISIDGIAIRASIVGLVIGDKPPRDPDQVPRNIFVENSSIVGIDEESSTLAVLYGACRNVSLRHNILAKGLYGLSVLVEGPHRPLDWRFSNNTCYRLSNFVVWDGPAENPPSFLVTDNLLVDVQFVHERLLEAAALADGQERFKNNLWVAAPVGSAERFQRLSAFADSLPLLSTDPAHADFLKPDFQRLSPSVKRDSFPGKYGSDEK